MEAAGVTQGRKPIDISIAGEFDDFGSVEFHAAYWSAIRRNGEVVSNHPQLNGQKNAAKVVVNGSRAYLLRRDGRIDAFPEDLELPAGIHDAVDIAIGVRDGIALRKHGRVIAWGKTLGDPSNDGCSDFTGIQSVALTWGSEAAQGFALTSDGKVIAFGGVPPPFNYRQSSPKSRTWRQVG